ncbi:RNA polymerase sigma factor [Amycolatopsis sp. NPDC059027]|uniref:RNA polymerase sigma factor n=1 Tax=unclassified Amycolatopsis TaxID=2618356 RepID=UPI00366D1B4E
MSTDDGSNRHGYREFSDFCRAHTERLVGFVIRLGASPADAEDVAQEVLLDLYESWDAVARPECWVWSVATRKYQRHFPLRHREIVTGTVPDRPMLVAPDDFAVQAEAAGLLWELLTLLPFQQRMVLAWRIDGFSHQEIATGLSTTPAAVRASAARARATLKETLRLRHEEAN